MDTKANNHAEQIALLQQALRGRQEEIGRLACRVGELEALRDAGAGAQADIRSAALEEAAMLCNLHAKKQSQFHQHAEMYVADFCAAAIRALKSQPVQQPVDAITDDDITAITHGPKALLKREDWDATTRKPKVRPNTDAADLAASARPSAAPGEARNQFTKKPVTIEAFQFQQRNTGPVPYPDWFEDVTRLDIMGMIRAQCHRCYASAIDREDVDTKYMTEIEDAIMGIYHGRYIAGYDLRKSEQPAARELTDAQILAMTEVSGNRYQSVLAMTNQAAIEFAREIERHLTGKAGAGEKA